MTTSNDNAIEEPPFEEKKKCGLARGEARERSFCRARAGAAAARSPRREPLAASPRAASRSLLFSSLRARAQHQINS